MWDSVKGVRGELLERKCVHVCARVSLTVSRPLKAYKRGCVLFTDHVLRCGILDGSFQDAAIMLTSPLSCHTPLEVL